jgi:hypothetical protein
MWASKMMRYRYNTLDWKLIIAVVVIVAIVIVLMVNRSSLIEFEGPKELTMVIKPNETVTFNSTIKSQPGANPYSNYTWEADGRNIFVVEEISKNFNGTQSRFPLESGETRKLRFRLTLVGEEPPEGRYFIDFTLRGPMNGRVRRISNTYRLWVVLESEED